jgi:putative phosphoesterase
MRIAVISDTHTNVKTASTLLDAVGDFELLIHLGDHVSDLVELASKLRCRAVGVCGNEDKIFLGDDIFPEEMIIPVGDITIFMTHGHLFDLNPYYNKEEWESKLSGLISRAKEKGAKIALFGHTHRSHLEDRDGVLLMNPGDMYFGAEWAHVGMLDIVGGDVKAEVYRFDKDLNREIFLSWP